MWNDSTITRDNSDSFLPRKALLFARRKIGERFYRPKINAEMREVLKETSFTIISNNCMGGVLYHDAGHEFTSPTINMAIDGEDFIRFLEKPKYYCNIREFEFIKYQDLSYPVARLDNIEIRFVHYKTKEECIEKWRTRSKRIDWDNLYIIGTDRDGMYKKELLKRFDSLPYKNKLLFTAQMHSEYDWAIQVPQFKHKEQVGVISYYADFKGHRYYDTVFDIATWIKERNNK